MKKIIYSILFIAFANAAMAITVPVAKAKTVGLNFLHSSLASTQNYINDITLIGSANYNTANGSTAPAYYIFEATSHLGFIIVSADDIVTPILGYSAESEINTAHLSPSFVKWVENYKNQIAYCVAHNIAATPEISTAWNDMFTNNLSSNRSPNAVSPLLYLGTGGPGITWDQSPNYNALCPYDNAAGELTVTGCVATAMAQIMRFWSYPTMGSGTHAYADPNYGTQSATFGATTYNWAGMPINVSSANNSVATLMYHCGVSVEMNYGIGSTGGSSAYVISGGDPNLPCAQNSYTNYFGYDPATIQGLERVNFTDPQWIALLKTDLDLGRPIQYAGYGTGGGHTFVCDGYDASNNFHMNWGWGGYQDGFFAVSALNPGGVGTGGGAGGFNADQQAVVGIKTIATVPTGNSLQLNSAVTINPNPIPLFGAFTVNADIINNSTSTFNGDFTAALFNSSYDFVDYVQTLTGASMPPGTHYPGGLDFASSGMLTPPGQYYVAIFYKEATGNWVMVDNGSGSNTNLVPVTISGSTDYIELFSAITPTPTTFVQGQPASVNANILNNGTTTYFGTYAVKLYTLDSGNYVETIGTYTESAGLPAGFAYTNPITFTSGGITAAPGTYLLAVMETEVGFGQYVAGGPFTNPIYINVVPPTISPDIYENNNTLPNAYVLPLSFTGNTASVNTTGSNNHIGTDIDFYSVNLASGYSYTITARAQDSYSNTTANTYTQDVLWSYSTGASFSLAYDDVMAAPFVFTGAGTVTFQVAPFFTGTTGTYRFDIDVVRTPSTVGINENTDLTNIHFYPNPASDKVSYKLGTDCKVNKIDVYNNIGQLVLTETNTTDNTLDISTLNNGIYFITVSTNKGNLNSKINVVK